MRYTLVVDEKAISFVQFYLVKYFFYPHDIYIYIHFQKPKFFMQTTKKSNLKLLFQFK